MPAIETVTVSGWAHLIDALYQGAWNEDLRRFRTPFVYRGMCDAACDLSTSLMRAARGYPDLARLEGHLLRNFRKYAQMDATVGRSIWSWLALAQHHGLQTRLLDWTWSPLIAAHFVTDNLDRYESDGVLWAVNVPGANRLLPAPLRELAEREGGDVFTAEMLDGVADSLDKLERLDANDFVVFLEPPSLNIRIANQFALFSLMSRPHGCLDSWLAAHEGLARRIVIPAALKWEVRDKLDQAGITERMLYPGLDGLGRWLSRYYRPPAGPRLK
jgi:hypothetical protein